MVAKFLRRGWYRYSKLGLRKKKKQKWKKPTGRDNKMREKRRGYAPTVSIGYGTNKNQRGLVNGKIKLLVNNLKDLENAEQNSIIVIGKIGRKKKINAEKFLKTSGTTKKAEIKKTDSKNKTSSEIKSLASSKQSEILQRVETKK